MAQWIWGAAALAGLGTLSITTVARAEAPLQVVYPPADHQTTAAQIFFIGTAAADQPVLLNGEPIADRSESGNFAPTRGPRAGDQHVYLHPGRSNAVNHRDASCSWANAARDPGLCRRISGSPGVDIARQPGDWVCLGAVAPRTPRSARPWPVRAIGCYPRAIAPIYPPTQRSSPTRPAPPQAPAATKAASWPRPLAI
jgi:N-acetylmuramoyl-L-alanine amidase